VHGLKNPYNVLDGVRGWQKCSNKSEEVDAGQEGDK